MQSFGSSLGSTFVTKALDPKNVRVVTVQGRERISELYELRVRIVNLPGALTDDEISQVLLAPCTLTIGNGDPIHGIAREVEVHEAVEDKPSRYEIVMVPTVWLFTISKVCRLFQGKSVKDMAQEILTRHSLSSGSHFDLRIETSNPRELAIQYHESDWDFLQRWFEHEGFFYWFEHSASGEKLVVADSNAAATPISGKASLSYRDPGIASTAEETILDWRSVQRRIPARVVLKDYNDLKPLLPLVGQADVDKKRGFGIYFEYGDHFEVPADGDALAQRRAERFLTEQLTVFGLTDSVRFHVGHTFTLSGHFDAGQNQKYLITEIEHILGPVQGKEDSDAFDYELKFRAIPFKVSFRPERKTPWPSIAGVIHGHIDSDGNGKYSTLDSKSRYKVRFPFDTAGKTGDASSTWVRMAQSYAGTGYGSHYPLHKGTEVLVAFYDGDPDRPVIVGAVPNAVTPAASTSKNASQSTIRSASGIHIAMDDEL